MKLCVQTNYAHKTQHVKSITQSHTLTKIKYPRTVFIDYLMSSPNGLRFNQNMHQPVHAFLWMLQIEVYFKILLPWVDMVWPGRTRLIITSFLFVRSIFSVCTLHSEWYSSSIWGMMVNNSCPPFFLTIYVLSFLWDIYDKLLELYY